MSELSEGFRLHRRFDRIGRLVGEPAMARLAHAHVAVIGLGGVGSVAAEALVRSGVGRVTLVDFDLVCVTNLNRQIQAMAGTIGKPKANVLAERLRGIDRNVEVVSIPLFYEARLADRILHDGLDYVVDAIDNVTAKCHLLDTCRQRGLPVVCSTGAAGRLDPTQVRVADLAQTQGDRLSKVVRKTLRQKYGHPRTGPLGIPAVFSAEAQVGPKELSYDRGEGFSCVCPGGDNEHHSCDERNVVWGTAGFVTGAFGYAAASVVVRGLAAVNTAAHLQQ